MKYYVYVLYRIDTPSQLTLDCLSLLYTPYYIGKGSNSRINRHSKFNNTKHKKDAITQSLYNKGHCFKDFSQIIKYFNTEEEAYLYESKLIYLVGLDNLSNYKCGGEGGYTTYRKGKTYEEIYGDSAESIKNKISESNKGKTPTKQTIAKKSESAKLYWENNRETHSDYLRGRKMLKEFCENQSKRLKGVKRTEEFRKKISAAMKGKVKQKNIKLKQLNQERSIRFI